LGLKKVTFGELVNLRKQQLDLSYADIAARISLHGYLTAKSTVSNWATGNRNPPLSMVNVRRAIAAALDLDPNQMMHMLGYVVLDEDHTAEGRMAAEIVDSLSENMRGVAISVLRGMLQAEGGA
jgi:transcriptional regulator with XRE-family HTH domain